MMDALAISRVLLIGIIINVAHAQDLVDYTPHLTSEEMEGKITTSTFTLQQPRCVFKNLTYVIWLVVAQSEAVKTFKNPPEPKDLPYQSFANNSFYLTLDTSASNYPCPEKSDDITVLRVGSETKCVMDLWRPNCNGPLPGPGPYRVKFLAMAKNSTDVIEETKWSDPITLIQGRNPDKIVPKPRRRRIETSIIIAILTILSAVLLASLIATFIYKYSNICEKPMSAEFTGIQDPPIVRYTTHTVHDPFSNN
ncbi:uroplakin-3b-like [Erythrolamprus reginae]|uniref:uroplakin-3b-like n=1 Tax=Erythrolamprus reginae TaxID=121349 RepID=UPI00396C62B3